MAEAIRFSKLNISDKQNVQTKNAFTDDGIDLLLIGKTGNGKSATGNSIMDRLVFESDCSSESVTTEIDFAVVDYKKRKIKVVDGPGIGDTNTIDDLEEATKQVMDKMSDAVIQNPDGYHAFLLVVKFDNRLTKEDQESIRILKAIFGESFIRNYCILLVTNGDQFYKKVKKMGTSFKKWCQSEGGIFQVLYNECNKRAVLFNNTTEDPKVKNKQMKKLIKTIDALQHKGSRYTNEHFEMAFRSRENLMVKVKEPRIRQDAMDKISIFMQRKKHIRSKDIDVQSAEMKELKGEVQSLLNKVTESDNQSGVLNELMTILTMFLEVLESNIEQTLQLGKEKKVIVEKKEEARIVVSKEDTIENELKLKFQNIMITNTNYDEEIENLDKKIEREIDKYTDLYRFKVDRLKREIRKEKKQLRLSYKQKDGEFKDFTEFPQKLKEIEIYGDIKLEKLQKERLEDVARIQKQKQEVEDKKQNVKDKIMTEIIAKFANIETKMAVIRLIEEINHLDNNLKQKWQEMTNLSEEKDINIWDMLNELKENYMDELKIVKPESRHKCPIQ